MFETCVDQLVKVTLTNEPVKTEFYNGTMFLRTVTQSQAQQVLARLSETFGTDKVLMSPIGDTGEFAYDFI
jgi:hypothetical protein